ncbi:MAG: tRNA (adenosine(37)-N6)-dimethylallyltransferase MiaA [Chlamydiales bacterium]|nr:tRNA (adenosine(37)-N6)-dimethylallyltransferase MiaA [Chlamydiales bacterium]
MTTDFHSSREGAPDFQSKKQSIATYIPKKKIIVIAGPTASGKTALSLKIAKALDGEIISADSMQVYKQMDIGTAKVSQEEQSLVKHHLIDVWDITNPCNVVRFCEDAQIAYREVFVRRKVPIIVGGVGFYIHSLIYGPPKGPPSNPQIRNKLEADFQKFGAELLYEKLSKLDPEYTQTITLQDKQKIIRALEIITITGKKVSDFPKPSALDVPEDIDFRCWFIHYPKEILYQKIEKRCEEMITNGFIEEVKKLKEMGIEKNPSACMAIGYRQCLQYLSSAQTEADYEHFMHEFKKASKQYARRQFTWFRKEPLFHWIDLSKHDLDFVAEVIIQDFETNEK